MERIGTLFGSGPIMDIVLSHKVTKKKLGIFTQYLKYPLIAATKILGFPPEFKAKEHDNLFTSKILEGKCDSFLDMGSGYGRMAFEICQKTGGKGICVDLDEEDIFMMNQLQNSLKANVTGLNKNILECDFEEGEFSVIFCNEFLEHIQDDEELLKYAYKWLKPEGRFIFQVPFHFTQIPEETLHKYGHVRNGYSEKSFNKISKDMFDMQYYRVGIRKLKYDPCTVCDVEEGQIHPLKLIGVGTKI